MVLWLRLGREFGGSSDFPLWFCLGSRMSSSGSDVDKVLVKENIKRYVRHLDKGGMYRSVLGCD